MHNYFVNSRREYFIALEELLWTLEELVVYGFYFLTHEESLYLILCCMYTY
jgi:hypothetical protein